MTFRIGHRHEGCSGEPTAWRGPFPGENGCGSSLASEPSPHEHASRSALAASTLLGRLARGAGSVARGDDAREVCERLRLGGHSRHSFRGMNLCSSLPCIPICEEPCLLSVALRASPPLLSRPLRACCAPKRLASSCLSLSLPERSRGLLKTCRAGVSSQQSRSLIPLPFSCGRSLFQKQRYHVCG